MADATVSAMWRPTTRQMLSPMGYAHAWDRGMQIILMRILARKRV
ncbi:MAG: hypothetical protein R2860_13935 [Desulfobacterales bacterium]